jgi:hypothetical protein
MDKDVIANEIRDLFFSPILAKVLSEAFEESGLENSDSFVEEAINNQSIQAKIKAKLAIGMSEKYTELGLPTLPDDIEVVIDEKGIDVINLKIPQNKDDDSSSNLE